MKKFIKIVIGYVFYTFPLTLVGYAFLFVMENRVSLSYGVFLNTLIYVSLIQTLIWTLTSLFLSISLFFSEKNRGVVLKKLSGIKERDEREVQIMGRALKSSYLTTMTILFFLLFISLDKIISHTMPFVEVLIFLFVFSQEIDGLIVGDGEEPGRERA